MFGRVGMMELVEEKADRDVGRAFGKEGVHTLRKGLILDYFPTRLTTETTYNRGKGPDLANMDAITRTIHSSYTSQH